jgi:hypothetical protein
MSDTGIGAAISTGAMSGLWTGSLCCMRRRSTLRRLLSDARYRDALKIMDEALQQPAPAEHMTKGTDPPAIAARRNQIAEAREKAVQSLQARGIPAPDARKNMALLLADIAKRIPR